MTGWRSALRGIGHGVWVMARGKADHRLAELLDWQADHVATAQSTNLGYTRECETRLPCSL